MGKAPDVKIFGTDFPIRDGTTIRNSLHVEDLAIAHVQALEHFILTQNSAPYRLGTGKDQGKDSTILEVVEIAKHISGVQFPAECDLDMIMRTA